ncbi:syntaxin-17 [Onthophagus taurus]|uniref:syntaxin-17 n=1 Tax=Onthophagus taurus TaxID=166361 RepID=UPI0039BEB724
MTTNTSPGLKEPFKYIEIPLQKFQDEALPYHQNLLQHHKNAIETYMFQKNTQKLSQEIKDKKRNVRQMKDLLYELDTLRAKVFDDDLDKFDNRTFSLRRSISAILKDYYNLEKSALAYTDSQNEINENTENENPFLGAEQIQIHDNLEKLRLQQASSTLERVENLNHDVKGLHEIYQELNTMVNVQKEDVNKIEENVEETQTNVNRGLSHLISASKLKTATYPVTGALIGGLVGGPLGLIAGAKIGGLAAISCGIVGYTGGKIITKINDKEINIDNQDGDTIPHENERTEEDNGIKKKI